MRRRKLVLELVEGEEREYPGRSRGRGNSVRTEFRLGRRNSVPTKVGVERRNCVRTQLGVVRGDSVQTENDGVW